MTTSGDVLRHHRDPQSRRRPAARPGAAASPSPRARWSAGWRSRARSSADARCAGSSRSGRAGRRAGTRTASTRSRSRAGARMSSARSTCRPRARGRRARTRTPPSDDVAAGVGGLDDLLQDRRRPARAVDRRVRAISTVSRSTSPPGSCRMISAAASGPERDAEHRRLPAAGDRRERLGEILSSIARYSFIHCADLLGDLLRLSRRDLVASASAPRLRCARAGSSPRAGAASSSATGSRALRSRAATSARRTRPSPSRRLRPRRMKKRKTSASRRRARRTCARPSGFAMQAAIAPAAAVGFGRPASRT